MHLLVFSCGVFGYITTMWVSNRLHLSPVANKPKDAQEGDDVGLEDGLPHAHETAALAAADEPIVSVPVDASAEGQDFQPASACTLPMPSQIVDAPDAFEGQSLPGNISLSETPMSDRVARLLAKKAERKARKAQLQADQEIESIGPEQDIGSVALAQEEQYSSPTAAAEPSLQHVVSISEHSGDFGTQTTLICASQKRASCASLETADLSTADEGQVSSWDAVETDSSWEGEDLEDFWQELAESHSDAQLSSEAMPTCGKASMVSCCGTDAWYIPSSEQQWWALQGSWSGRQEDSRVEDDCWMLPFDEILQRRAGQMEVSCELLVSADGQQIFSDGEQFFVLASVPQADAPMAQLASPSLVLCEPMPGQSATVHDQAWSTPWGFAA